MFTILGASGFIGSHLVAHLRKEGAECLCPERFERISGAGLGDVICCVGLTADFRMKPFETVEAHVCYLVNALRQYKFDSFMYLSSTRVYGSRPGIASEDDAVRVEPLKGDDLYNISKVMGESICFSSGRHNIRVVRLSNVYGYDQKSENLVFTLIKDALASRKIVLGIALGSAKDHVSVSDVVRVLPQIALHGRQQVYNVARGENTTVGQITNKLRELTGCTVEVNADARTVRLPRIDINRVRKEFGFSAADVLDDLGPLVEEYRQHLKGGR